VEILLSRDNAPYVVIGGGDNTGSCIVDVPAGGSAYARIMVRGEGSPGLFAISQPFTIE
jgi:hypothetical protein